MAEEEAKGMKWLNEEGLIDLTGTKTAGDIIDRILEVRDAKYAELDRKYAAPRAELNARIDKERNIKEKFLEATGMSEREYDDAELLDNVSDDWEPEDSWDEFAESIFGKSVEEEDEDTRQLLEETGILAGYELVDGVYKKKAEKPMA